MFYQEMKWIKNIYEKKLTVKDISTENMWLSLVQGYKWANSIQMVNTLSSLLVNDCCARQQTV